MKGPVIASIMPAAARACPFVPLADLGMLVERLDQLPRLGEIGGRQHFARLAPGHHFAREQQSARENARAPARCRAARPARCVPRACQRRISAMRSAIGLGIDGAERLVEQDERRVLQQQPREQHALELAARQRADRTLGEIDQPDRGQRAGDLVVAARIEAAPGADLAPQPHRHAVEHRDREAAVDLDLLRQIGDVRFVEAVAVEAAAERLELADDALEQGRLAGAVRADDGEQRAALDLAGDVMHGGMPVIAERQVVEDDGRLGGGDMVMSTPTARRPTAAPRRPPRWRAAPAPTGATARSRSRLACEPEPPRGRHPRRRPAPHGDEARPRRISTSLLLKCRARPAGRLRTGRRSRASPARARSRRAPEPSNAAWSSSDSGISTTLSHCRQMAKANLPSQAPWPQAMKAERDWSRCTMPFCISSFSAR